MTPEPLLDADRVRADLRLLAAMLGITSPAQALDLVDRFYRPHRLSPKTQLLLESILAGDES